MNEDLVERAALGWFEAAGYDTARGADLSPGGDAAERGDYDVVVLERRLRAALRNINPHVPEDAIDQAVRTVVRPPEPDLARNNRWFHRLLTDGVDVEYQTADGELRGDKAWLVDFDTPARNDLLVVRQLTIVNGAAKRRPDLVVFVNGLPIAVIELKHPTDEQADTWTAFAQLQDYQRAIPALFVYNELLVASDGLVTRAGSLTAGADRFAPWRSSGDGHEGSPLEGLVLGLFEPAHLLDYLRHCVTFEEDERTGAIVKRSAGYHQLHAVRKTRTAVTAALRPDGDGRGGIVWHTQGSGKSLTMLMLSSALIAAPQLANPTIVVLTDRNDLDEQLLATFVAGRELLRQAPEQALSREDLAARLHRASGGVLFTTIQKFAERGGVVSDRSNIVVLVDEAHRSQYGFQDGGARWMREALPNATYVGFTGTPLERDDRSTPAVFGDYTDIYDIRQAIADGATVPIYYEMRLVKLLVDEAGAAEAERSLDAAAAADERGEPLPGDIAIPLAELIGAPERLRVVAREVVEHLERRLEVIEGKAMVVCTSREICMDLYDQIVALRPQWHGEPDDAGFVKVVMTGSAGKGERVAGHARTKARREALARRFKDPDDDLRLVIVCDMWLTGFDCPPMHTMYLDKPLAGHHLMQAIARVNRVFGEKPGGVVVDFLGVADALRAAVQTYTQAGGDGSPVDGIQTEALPVMERQYEALRDFFAGFTLPAFAGAGEAEQLRAVAAGAEHVLEQDDGLRRFTALVAGLSKAFALCVPRPETDAIRDPLAFFQSVRAALRKRLADGGPPPAPDARAAVRQVIAGAIASDGVIDLFAAAGIADTDVGVLSESFLERVGALPQKHLALETLRQLLNDEIRGREQVNIVQSRSFRQSLEKVLRRYNNRAIDTAEVVDELLSLARAIRAAMARGEESGLTEEERAFYDALAENGSAREVLQDETLRQIACELAERVRAKATLDWTEREAVRADMRRTVRRLLARHGYPPDAQEAATQLVLRQAELMARTA